MPFSVLHNAADWEKYQQRTAAESQMAGIAGVGWGSNPPDYPCLAGTKFLPGHVRIDGATVPPKFLTVFLTTADAKALLVASGFTVAAPGSLGVGPVMGAPVDTCQQTQTNKWLTAHILAMIALMEDTKILNRDAYEERLVESLDAVTYWQNNKKDELRGKLSQTQQAVLDRMQPPG